MNSVVVSRLSAQGSVYSCQEFNTGFKSDIPQLISAKPTVLILCVRNLNEVHIPKFPPPAPHEAQKRSELHFLFTRITQPFASTISNSSK